MAATYKDNGGSVNSQNLEFTYDFPVLQTEDVKVSLNGVTQATTKYTATTNPAKIVFNTTSPTAGLQVESGTYQGAPVTGVTVRVYRETTVGKASGDEDPKAVFAAGSSIRAGDLNANIEQALFGIHEQQEKIIQTEDLADDAITSAKLDTNIDIAGTLDVTGATTLDSTLNVAGTSTHATVDINGGAIDGTTIGASSAAAGTFTTGTIATADINGGAIDGTTIGANSAAAGTFTNGTIATADINGGAIDGTTIGANSAAAGTFTTVNASGTITGNVTGNITGDITGDVTGDLTGNADTATALATGRTIASTGDVVWNSGSFDGTANKTAAATIQADAVTYAKMQNVSATDRVLGRDSSGAGVVEEITPANLRTMINVEDGADVTDATNVDAAGAVMNNDLATKGTIIVGDGSGDPTILGVGTNNHVLVADSNEPSGVKWATVPAGSGLSNVVEDTTPQLGGALDVQAQEINTSTTNGNIKLTPNGTGFVEVKGNTNPGTIQLNCENNSHGVKIKGPAHSAAASYTLTLPNDDGDANEVLKTDGSGNLDWTAITTDLVGDTSPQLGGNLDVNGQDIVSTSNANIDIVPNGTGDVTLQADTIQVGDSNADVTITTNGTGDLTLSTNSGTNSGTIEIEDGANNDIVITASGTGTINLNNDVAILNGGNSSGGKITLQEGGANGTATVGIKCPDDKGSDASYTITLPSAAPAANGQVLSATTAGVASWSTVSGTITALNNQAANRLTTIGSTTTELDGEANLTFTAVTTAGGGLVSVNQITGRGFECPATVSDDWTIHGDNNAFFPGPMTVAANKTVTVPANRTLTIV